MRKRIGASTLVPRIHGDDRKKQQLFHLIYSNQWLDRAMPLFANISVNTLAEYIDKESKRQSRLMTGFLSCFSFVNSFLDANSVLSMRPVCKDYAYCRNELLYRTFIVTILPHVARLSSIMFGKLYRMTFPNAPKWNRELKCTIPYINVKICSYSNRFQFLDDPSMFSKKLRPITTNTLNVLAVSTPRSPQWNELPPPITTLMCHKSSDGNNGFIQNALRPQNSQIDTLILTRGNYVLDLYARNLKKLEIDGRNISLVGPGIINELSIVVYSLETFDRCRHLLCVAKTITLHLPLVSNWGKDKNITGIVSLAECVHLNITAPAKNPLKLLKVLECIQEWDFPDGKIRVDMKCAPFPRMDCVKRLKRRVLEFTIY